MENFLTIIIPVIKTAYFRTALDSVVSQNRNDVDILVVDNKADAELAWVGAVENTTLVRRPERLPLADNWTDALLRSTGRYVMFLSDDDFLEPESLNGLIGYLRAHRNPIVTVVGMRKVDLQGRFLHESQPGKSEETLAETLFQYYANGRDIGMNLVFDRDRFIGIGGFVPVPGSGLWIDVMTCFKCGLHSNIGYYNNTVLHYRTNPLGVSKAISIAACHDRNVAYEEWVGACMENLPMESCSARVLKNSKDAYFANLHSRFYIATVAGRQWSLCWKILSRIAPSPREFFAALLDTALFFASRVMRKLTSTRNSRGLRF